MHSFFASVGRSLPLFLSPQDGRRGDIEEKKTQNVMYGRLLAFASTTLVKNKDHHNQFSLWKEPYRQAARWKPCADTKNIGRKGHNIKKTGFILVSANGGLNQQRVAVCNAVSVAALLNATLVLPKFLYSSVWKDSSQFGDIYQEDYFIDFLEDDVKIVKKLPSHLQSLELEALGSQITDEDIMKESAPMYFVKVVLPLLLRNGVVHFLGFGNRLAFDPMPSDLQAPKVSYVSAYVSCLDYPGRGPRSTVEHLDTIGVYAKLLRKRSKTVNTCKSYDEDVLSCCVENTADY